MLLVQNFHADSTSWSDLNRSSICSGLRRVATESARCVVQASNVLFAWVDSPVATDAELASMSRSVERVVDPTMGALAPRAHRPRVGPVATD